MSRNKKISDFEYLKIIELTPNCKLKDIKYHITAKKIEIHDNTLFRNLRRLKKEGYIYQINRRIYKRTTKKFPRIDNQKRFEKKIEDDVKRFLLLKDANNNEPLFNEVDIYDKILKTKRAQKLTTLIRSRITKKELTDLGVDVKRFDSLLFTNFLVILRAEIHEEFILLVQKKLQQRKLTI